MSIKFTWEWGEALEITSIIDKAKGGDRNAFILIYNTYRQKVYSTAYFILKDYQHAEDVVQETFLQVHLKIHKLKFSEAFETWLYKITVNNCFSLLRKLKKNDVIELDENLNKSDYTSLSDPDNLIIQKEIETKVMEFVYSLPDKHRIALTLFYFNNLKIKDIADIMDCSEGTIKSRIFYRSFSGKSATNTCIFCKE